MNWCIWIPCKYKIRLMRNILGMNPTNEGSLGKIYFGVEFSNWGQDYRKCLMVTGQQLRGPYKTVYFLETIFLRRLLHIARVQFKLKYFMLHFWQPVLGFMIPLVILFSIAIAESLYSCNPCIFVRFWHVNCDSRLRYFWQQAHSALHLTLTAQWLAKLGVVTLSGYYNIFIGPETDHWECLSQTDWLPNWLTHSLLFSKLYWCDPGMWRWQLKLVEVVTVTHVDEKNLLFSRLIFR